MKLKDLLSESPEDKKPKHELMGEPAEDDPFSEDHDDEACPGCGRRPGDGVGDDCDDFMGCGYWKEWARDAAAEWKRDNKHDGGMDEGVEVTVFDRYMEETLRLEDRRLKQLKAPVVAEGFGKIRQKRVQETPFNRIKIGGK